MWLQTRRTLLNSNYWNLYNNSVIKHLLHLTLSKLSKIMTQSLYVYRVLSVQRGQKAKRAMNCGSSGWGSCVCWGEKEKNKHRDKQWSGPVEERKQTYTHTHTYWHSGIDMYSCTTYTHTTTLHDRGILTLNKPKQEIGGSRGSFNSQPEGTLELLSTGSAV